MHVDLDNFSELFYLDSYHFDREGKLYVHQHELTTQKSNPTVKQYLECLCRLRGNLFWIAHIDSSHDSFKSIQLVVLKHFEVKLCENPNVNEFYVDVSESKVRPSRYSFICPTRFDRDKWIESFHVCSLKFLFSLRQSLSDECARKLSDANHRSQSAIQVAQISNKSQVINANSFYISINCDNIVKFLNIIPSLYVKVYLRQLYLNQKWIYLGSTEIIRSNSPHFKHCIALKVNDRAIFELKFELFDIIEQEFNTSNLIAFAYCPLNEHIKRCEKRFNIRLNSLAGERCGTLTFRVIHSLPNQIRKSVTCDDLFSKTSKKLFFSHFNSTPNLSEMCSINSPSFAEDKQELFTNMIFKKFAFSLTKKDSYITVEERMAESRFVFFIPQLLMKFYTKTEGDLKRMVENERNLLPEHHFNQVNSYHQRFARLFDQTMGDLANFMSTHSFRPSKCKTEACLQFVPINFHKQTCLISSGGKSSRVTLFSVGAYACHHLGFDKLGMKSILANSHPLVIQTWTLLKKLLQVMRCKSTIGRLIDGEIVSVMKGDQVDCARVEPFYRSVCILCEQLIDLVPVDQTEALVQQLLSLRGDSTPSASFDDESQLEPIDLIYLNIKACLVAIKHKLSQEKATLHDFDSCNRKLKSAIHSLCKSIFCGYLSTFCKLKQDQIQSLYDLRFRYLALLSQALTTLITFIMDKLEDASYVEQLSCTKCVLVEYEVLLSCFFEELGMVEDMVYILEEIANSVQVVLVANSTPSPNLIPEIDFNSNKICLTFATLSQGASCIECRVLPIIFNVGVNYKATIADSFKKNFQEELNLVNYNKLREYVIKFHKNDNEINRLLDTLRHEIYSSKSKNIEILNLAAKLVHRLNGIKVTCCKSAKDRTGMSVTLEEVRSCFALLGLQEDQDSTLFCTMLDTLRRDGVRMDNVQKNIGARKYAFNMIQLLTFPPHFRPPSGTYSNVDT